MRRDKAILNQIWAVYNHLPGGHMVAIHFEEYTRQKRMGNDMTKDVVFTSEEQVKGFEKSDFVALNLKGQILRNKILVYAGSDKDLSRNPKAADVVLEWARQQGVEPIYTKNDKAVKVDDSRMDAVEQRVIKLESKLDDQDKTLNEILKAVSVKK